MLRFVRSCSARSAGLLAALGWAASASAVSIDWVTVGDPGNDCENQSQGCFGAVAATYSIAETEVTNAQYVDFLNAVAVSDPGGLYNIGMQNAGSGLGGINRTGSDGSYVYTTASGRGNMPVNYVSFYDALRFANWMHNGQPTGAQGAATTEDGSYTITAQGITDNSIFRNAGASIVLTSEDEWYKAAYFDGTDYFAYPAEDNVQTVCAEPTADANRANCGLAIGSGSGDLTPVGSYTGSASPYGTFDQGGNVYEWNESLIVDGFRGMRGGAFHHSASFLAAETQSGAGHLDEEGHIGFRLAKIAEPIPEPSTGLLVASGLLGLALRRKPRTA